MTEKKSVTVFTQTQVASLILCNAYDCVIQFSITIVSLTGIVDTKAYCLSIIEIYGKRKDQKRLSWEVKATTVQINIESLDVTFT